MNVKKKNVVTPTTVFTFSLNAEEMQNLCKVLGSHSVHSHVQVGVPKHVAEWAADVYWKLVDNLEDR